MLFEAIDFVELCDSGHRKWVGRAWGLVYSFFRASSWMWHVAWDIRTPSHLSEQAPGA